MKEGILFLLCLSILAAVPAFAQTKTVTNADLEKFRQKRLKAEKDYRENYARMGFPSPEELERQIEKSRIEREELAARLTAERLQREQIEAARAEAERQSEPDVYFVPDNLASTDLGYYYGFPNFIYPGGRILRGRRNYNYPVNIGNGIPIVNYYGYPPVRRVRPASRWLRR